jgi:hypothetical protein
MIKLLIIAGGGLVGYTLLKQNGIDILQLNMSDLEPYIGEHAKNIEKAIHFLTEDLPKMLEEYIQAANQK